MIALMKCRPTGSWIQVFAGASMTFLVGSVAFVLFWPLGLAVWAFAVSTIVRRFRVGTEMRQTRATDRTRDAEWDARWARIGGRLP